MEMKFRADNNRNINGNDVVVNADKIVGIFCGLDGRKVSVVFSEGEEDKRAEDVFYDVLAYVSQFAAKELVIVCGEENASKINPALLAIEASAVGCIGMLAWGDAGVCIEVEFGGGSYKVVKTFGGKAKVL